MTIMILIVGASGRLGGAVARRLLADSQPVRAMSRTPEKLAALSDAGAEVVVGDLLDAASLQRACQGVESVFSAAHAFDGKGANTPHTVDDAGVRRLIAAAQAAGVERFTLMSILGARADHPVDLFRAKYLAEQMLKASGLSATILRPSAFMELWLSIIAEPMLKQGRAMIFGRGQNPINFVSVDDVAHFALIALRDPQARGLTIEMGGPDNVSLTEMVTIIERATGKTARRQHIPLVGLRAMSVLARPLKPAFARQAAAAAYMDTHDMTFDPSAILQRFPMILRRMEDVAHSQFGGVA
jgi:NADH dehydrogenase